MAPILILKTYFGLLPHQDNAMFLSEVRKLSAKDREELVNGAAKELGVEVTTKS